MRLAYLAVTNTLSFVRLLPMSDREKEIEIMVLRHQLAVSQRQSTKPAFTLADRFLLASLLHHLPMDKLRQLQLLVRPDTGRSSLGATPTRTCPASGMRGRCDRQRHHLIRLIRERRQRSEDPCGCHHRLTHSSVVGRWQGGLTKSA
jgi:hypothetical protein